MKWFKKIIKAPSGESVELEGLETWMVRWTSRHGEFHSETKPQVQVFTNAEDAEHFAKSLRDAFALIKHSSGNTVVVEMQI